MTHPKKKHITTAYIESGYVNFADLHVQDAILTVQTNLAPLRFWRFLRKIHARYPIATYLSAMAFCLYVWASNVYFY